MEQTQMHSTVQASWLAWVGRLRSELNLPVSVRWLEVADEWLALSADGRSKLRIDVKDLQGVVALLSPTLDQLGAAYVDGHLDVDGPVNTILAAAHALSNHAQVSSQSGGDVQSTEEMDFSGKNSWLRRIIETMGDRQNQRQVDVQSIRYHYDVSNAFYQQWLDPEMLYSCAYFENGDETLAEAQRKKMDYVLRKLQLQDGQKLLDIGCGWGALVLHAAQRFDVRCVGVTLSKNQFEWACQRVRDAGLSDRVEIRLQDYRDVTETFDRISSVGMMEHVGIKNLVSYFRCIHSLLRPGGWAFNHSITSRDAIIPAGRNGVGHFFEQYVAPNAELPHIGTVLTDMQVAGLDAVDVEGMRRHYERTTSLWSEAFETHSAALRGMVDERTWRIWRVYLAGCAWAFESDAVSAYQVLCHREGASARVLPWSRRWMYGENVQERLTGF